MENLFKKKFKTCVEHTFNMLIRLVKYIVFEETLNSPSEENVKHIRCNNLLTPTYPKNNLYQHIAQKCVTLTHNQKCTLTQSLCIAYCITRVGVCYVGPLKKYKHI